MTKIDKTLVTELEAAAFRKLVEHLAQAFALHPWVAKVVRVEKRYPAEVVVEQLKKNSIKVTERALRG